MARNRSKGKDRRGRELVTILVTIFENFTYTPLSALNFLSILKHVHSTPSDARAG